MPRDFFIQIESVNTVAVRATDLAEAIAIAADKGDELKSVDYEVTGIYPAGERPEPQLTEDGRTAIRYALGAAMDDLVRMDLQRRANPGWRSGNGMSIQDMIAACEDKVRSLQADVASHG